MGLQLLICLLVGLVCGISELEYLSLVDLFNSTGGYSSWERKENWLIGDPCLQSWFGIYCINVTLVSLNLHQNGLIGSIPESVKYLTSISSFKLDSNQISGMIPTQIAELLSLRLLSLDNNLLEGTLPSEISTLPLRSLSVTHNSLQGTLPLQYGQLTNLISLQISNNNFHGSLPSSFSQLTLLQSFTAHKNHLSGDLKVFETMPSLKSLSLSNNYFEGTLPSSWGKLTWLYTLYIDNNNLNGTIPPSYSNLVHLSTLLMDNTQLCAICLPFRKEITTCTMKGVKQGCDCDFYPCGKENCVEDLTCTSCLGNYLSLGTCENSVWVIPSSKLTEKNAFFVNSSILIMGDLNISLHSQNSSVILNGSLFGDNLNFILDQSYLEITDDLKLSQSTFNISIDSTMTIYGKTNFSPAILNLNLKQKKPEPKEYLIISAPHSIHTQWPEIHLINKNNQDNTCTIIQQTDSHLSISFPPCSSSSLWLQITLPLLFILIPALLILVRKIHTKKMEQQQLLKIT